jgi:predicted permease
MRRLFSLLRFRRDQMERDLDRELRYHLDRRREDLMQSGLDEAEARRQAAIEFGSVARVKEEVRDAWLTRWARDLAADLRISVRTLRRSPSFTMTAVLSLALGIGATTAIYSLVDQLVLHALPVQEPERLVLIDWKGDQATVNAFGSGNLMSYPICRDLHLQAQFFDGVLCRAATTVNLSTGGEHRPAAAELVSGSYFAVLGVRPAVGRLLTVEDDRTPGGSPVVVLSYDFWKTQLASAADVVGRKVLVNKHAMTVVGVAAEGFHGVDVGEVPSLWIPAAMSAQAIPGFDGLLSRRVRWMQILARLRSDVTLGQARAGLQPWFKAMLHEDSRRADYPTITAERRRRFLASTLELTPAPQGHSPLRSRLSQPLGMLFAATSVLLVLTCLNVAGLFVARGSARRREITTRLALGASPARIARQLLADSLVLALGGGMLGVVLAPLVMRALISFLPTDIASHALRAVVDTRVLLFASLISVAAGLLTGLAPALQAGRRSLARPLQERGATASGSLRLRRIMVTAQIAFTLILVVGAALFVQTLSALMAKGPGFDTSSLISFGIDPLRHGYTASEGARLTRRIHDEIRALPTAHQSAVARFQLLTGGSWNNYVTVQNHQRTTTDRLVHLNAVSPGFFATLGAGIVAGRDFDERDAQGTSEDRPRVAIVNEAFVKRYFGGRSPLGARIAPRADPDVQPDIEIVGVVANITYRGVREEWEQAYFPLISAEGGHFYVRVQGTSEAALASIRTILREAEPTLPITYFRTLDEQVSRSLNTERMLATLSSGFGTLALLLSLVGLYGVMSFTVTQRTREIGVRLALGATRAAALWLVLRDALMMIAAGVGLALPSLWVLSRFLESQLYGVTPTDPSTIATATVILCTTGMASALVPALHASAVNPTDALRCE